MKDNYKNTVLDHIQSEKKIRQKNVAEITLNFRWNNVLIPASAHIQSSGSYWATYVWFLKHLSTKSEI